MSEDTDPKPDPKKKPPQEPPKDQTTPEQVDPNERSELLDGLVDDTLSTLMSAPSKEDFDKLQKKVEELKQANIDAEKAKDKVEREYAFKELKRLNPSLAKIHEKSGTSTLKVVIATAKEIKSGFPSLGKEPKDPVKAGPADHETVEYDFVNNKWMYT